MLPKAICFYIGQRKKNLRRKIDRKKDISWLNFLFRRTKGMLAKSGEHEYIQMLMWRAFSGIFLSILGQLIFCESAMIRKTCKILSLISSWQLPTVQIHLRNTISGIRFVKLYRISSISFSSGKLGKMQVVLNVYFQNNLWGSNITPFKNYIIILQ